MFLNNFNQIAKKYQPTNEKPDKQHSILPTVLNLIGNTKDKIVLDVACGSGFFTFPIAESGAKLVIGIDSSIGQIALARQGQISNTEFRVIDAFVDNLPESDITVVPFVANYAKDKNELERFFCKVFQSLRTGGSAIFVMDLLNPCLSFGFKDRRRFGAMKWWCSPSFCGTDGGLIRNDLYNSSGKLLCQLWAQHYSQQTIQFALQAAGFRDINWHKPVISEQGLAMYGKDFWDGYTDDCQLAYITASRT